MTDPRHPAFWLKEEQNLWDTLAQPIIKVVFAGAQAGVLAIPKKFQVLADWDVINQSALDYLQKYRLSTITNISKTTRDHTIKAIDAWVRSGEPIQNLEARLAYTYGDTRANSIAVTEVTRMYAEGNTLSWKATGFIKEATYHTANDEHVCEICSPLDGQVVDVDDYGYKPPLHVLCRCFQTPIVDVEAVGEKIRGILGEPPTSYKAQPIDELIERFWAQYRAKEQNARHHR